MSWDRIEGQWKQRRGKAQNYWGKLMNDELAAVSGKYVELVGRLQEKYGIAKEEAKEQVACFKLECAACRSKTAAELRESHRELMKMRKALSEQKKSRRKGAKSKTSPTK